MTEKKIVALLPMKAHSERVKGKNFRDFCGKPLFRWILDSLMTLSEIDRIVINTDARKILEENGLYSGDRILVRDRRADICGDFVSMNEILADDLSAVEADIYLMTHTTNPLLGPDTIRLALNRFTQAQGDGAADSLFTVTTHRTRFYRQDGSAINHDPENLVRTQDLEPYYEENSNLYIFTKPSFLRTGARIGTQPIMFETPRIESIDIDTPEDWEFATVAARYQLDQGSESK